MVSLDRRVLDCDLAADHPTATVLAYGAADEREVTGSDACPPVSADVAVGDGQNPASVMLDPQPRVMAVGDRAAADSDVGAIVEDRCRSDVGIVRRDVVIAVEGDNRFVEQ